MTHLNPNSMPTLRLKAIVAACAMALSHVALAQGVSLRSATALDESPQATEETASFVSADSLETTDDEIILKGKAELRRSGTVIRGEEIVYTQSTDTVNVKGDALMVRDGVRFEGPEMTYQIETESGEMKEADFQYAVRGIRGTTAYAHFMNGVSTEFQHATLTTCKPGSKAWWVEADRIVIDEETQFATAKNVSFHLAGLPVMGLPWAAFPIGTDRQSGLLVPTVGMSSTLGIDISQPIYWNIAPNYDYTLTPRVMGKRGVALGNEFRFLTQNAGGTLTYDYLHKDKEFNDQSRYFGSAKVWAEWNGIRLRTDYNKASDVDYIDDFSTSIYETSEAILPQDVFLSYGKNFWNATLSVQKSQALKDEDGNQESDPYEKVPQLNWRAFVADFHGFEIESEMEATRFHHKEKNKVEGDRLYMRHSVAYPIRQAGWFVTPKAMLTGVQYSLDADTIGHNAAIEKSSHFVVPTFSLNSGLIFERDTTWFSRSATQTLEPQLFYAYTPYRDQSHMPKFESSFADLSFSTFVSENIFTGHDRVSEANNLSALLTSRFLDKETGYEWMRLGIGQRYYFQDQRVSLEGNNGIGKTEASKSDLLASFSANITRDVSFNSSVQYSTSLSDVTRANVGIRWHPKPSAVIGLYYRYNVDKNTLANYEEDRIKQVDFAVQWPITNRFYVVGRYNYSFFDDKYIEALGGVEYVEDCWALRLVAQRRLKDTNEYDTAFYIQLELTGLGSVGSNPLEELRRNIPGYQAATAKPGQTGLYDYYE